MTGHEARYLLSARISQVRSVGPEPAQLIYAKLHAEARSFRHSGSLERQGQRLGKQVAFVVMRAEDVGGV